MELQNKTETYHIPGLCTLIIEGDPSIENCKQFVKILLDAKRKREVKKASLH